MTFGYKKDRVCSNKKSCSRQGAYLYATKTVIVLQLKGLKPIFVSNT